MNRALAQVMELLRGDPSADRAVPPSGVTGHLSVLGAAAMALLAVFALSACLAAGRVADRWTGTIALGATVEVPVSDAQRAEAIAFRVLDILKATPGIAESRRLTPEDTKRLLSPWMGDGAVVDDLPFPILISVRESGELDRDALRLRLEGEAPEARYVRHDTWRAQMLSAAGRIRWLGLGALGLTLGVTGVIVTLAARASLAMNSGVIGTLRLIGAKDSYIARAFVRRFTLRGLVGSAAGTLAGIVLLLLLPAGGADALAALRPASFAGWLLMLVIPAISAIMAFLATRRAALRTLGRIQ